MSILGGTTQLETSVCVNHTGKKRVATVHTAVTTLTAGMHVQRNTATYGNGVQLGAVDTDDNTAIDKIVEIMEVPAINETNTTPWSKTAASVPATPIEVVECEEGKEYILKGNNLTIAEGQLIIRAASGLFAGVNVAHNATPLVKAAFRCTRACSASTYVRAKYLGLRTVYTT